MIAMFAFHLIAKFALVFSHQIAWFVRIIIFSIQQLLHVMLALYLIVKNAYLRIFVNFVKKAFI